VIAPNNRDSPSAVPSDKPKLLRCNAELNLSQVVLTAARIQKELIMPFLIPVLVGIPVLFGGGYVIYHLVH
jgi:hypothetical protein